MFEKRKNHNAGKKMLLSSDLESNAGQMLGYDVGFSDMYENMKKISYSKHDDIIADIDGTLSNVKRVLTAGMFGRDANSAANAIGRLMGTYFGVLQFWVLGNLRQFSTANNISLLIAVSNQIASKLKKIVNPPLNTKPIKERILQILKENKKKLSIKQIEMFENLALAFD